MHPNGSRRRRSPIISRTELVKFASDNFYIIAIVGIYSIYARGIIALKEYIPY